MDLPFEPWPLAHADVDNDGSYSRAIVYLGTDDSRQSNRLNYEALNLKLAANYEMGNHLFTAGFEQDDLDVYNLFIQHTETENRFDEECGSSNPNGCIDAFREGRPDDIYYGNAMPSNNPEDGAAEWAYKINTAYLQDEWITLGGDLTVVFGIRYDWYSSNDQPAYNQKFFDRQGFANTSTIDGLDLIQPRLGFNWTITPDFSMRGGVGLYSGGNPNVWLSNNFSNDGFRIAQLRESVIERDPPPAENCGEGVDFSLFDIALTGGGNPLYYAEFPEDIELFGVHLEAAIAGEFCVDGGVAAGQRLEAVDHAQAVLVDRIDVVEVPLDEALLVSGLDGLGQLQGDAESLLDGDRSALQAIGQIRVGLGVLRRVGRRRFRRLRLGRGGHLRRRGRPGDFPVLDHGHAADDLVLHVHLELAVLLRGEIGEEMAEVGRVELTRLAR